MISDAETQSIFRSWHHECRLGKTGWTLSCCVYPYLTYTWMYFQSCGFLQTTSLKIVLDYNTYLPIIHVARCVYNILIRSKQTGIGVCHYLELRPIFANPLTREVSYCRNTGYFPPPICWGRRDDQRRENSWRLAMLAWWVPTRQNCLFWMNAFMLLLKFFAKLYKFL